MTYPVYDQRHRVIRVFVQEHNAMRFVMQQRLLGRTCNYTAYPYNCLSNEEKSKFDWEELELLTAAKER